MIPPAFGWSAGDIATAIQILGHILKAFHQAKGAKKQYALSCGFLSQLVPVVTKIQAQSANGEDEYLRTGLVQQCEAISAAYEEFDGFLQKKYNGLTAGQPDRARIILHTIRWSLDDLHQKVQKMKDQVTAALQPCQTLMLQEIVAKVLELKADGASNTTRHEQVVRQVETVMKEIADHQKWSEEIAREAQAYQLFLKEDLNKSQQEHTSRICGDLADLEADVKLNHEMQLQVLRTEAASLKEVHQQLSQCRRDILHIVEDLQRRADKDAEIADWQRLRDRAKSEAESSENLQKLFQENLQTTAELSRCMGDVSKDKRVKRFADRMECGSKIGSVLMELGLFRVPRTDNAQCDWPNIEPTQGSAGQKSEQHDVTALSVSSSMQQMPPQLPMRRSLTGPPSSLYKAPGLHSESLATPLDCPIESNATGNPPGQIVGHEGSVEGRKVKMKPKLPTRPSSVASTLLSPSPCTTSIQRATPPLPPRSAARSGGPALLTSIVGDKPSHDIEIRTGDWEPALSVSQLARRFEGLHVMGSGMKAN